MSTPQSVLSSLAQRLSPLLTLLSLAVPSALPRSRTSASSPPTGRGPVDCLERRRRGSRGREVGVQLSPIAEVTDRRCPPPSDRWRKTDVPDPPQTG